MLGITDMLDIFAITIEEGGVHIGLEQWQFPYTNSWVHSLSSYLVSYYYAWGT